MTIHLNLEIRTKRNNDGSISMNMDFPTCWEKKILGIVSKNEERGRENGH